MRELTPDELQNLPEFDRDEYTAYIADLKDIPHDETLAEKRTGLHGSEISLYEVNDVQVLSCNNTWTPVSYWSEHCFDVTEIVDLSNGMQIYTDDDPRAIFGQQAGDPRLSRFTPSEALFHDVSVPISSSRIIYTEPFKEVVTFELFEDAYYFLSALRMDRIGPARIDMLGDNEFTVSEAEFSEDRWARVIAVTDTKQRMAGYDLSVPGFETFTSSDGVVLSNTFGVFIPSQPRAVDDVKEKLMPSKQIFSIRNTENVVNLPKQDLLWGLWRAANTPSETTHRFVTKGDALRAIQQGRIKLSDNIEILDDRE